jgi:hypothetical protein
LVLDDEVSKKDIAGFEDPEISIPSASVPLLAREGDGQDGEMWLKVITSLC